MSPNYRDRSAGSLFMGLVLLVVGTMLLLDNLQVVEIDFDPGRWWPLLLVLIGVKRLIVFRGPTAWISGLFWIGAGALFLFQTTGLLNARIPSLIFPILVIWFGVAFMVGPRGKFGVAGRSKP